MRFVTLGVHERRAAGGEPRRLLERLGGAQQGHVGALAGDELHADGHASTSNPAGSDSVGHPVTVIRQQAAIQSM